MPDRDSGRSAEDEPIDESVSDPYPWRSNSPKETGGEQESETSHPSSASREDINGSHQSQSSYSPPEEATGHKNESQTQGSDSQQGQQDVDSVANDQPIPEHVLEEEYTKEKSEPKPLWVKMLLGFVGLGSRIFHMKILGLHWIVPRLTGQTDKHKGISGRFYPGDMMRGDETEIFSDNPSRWMSVGGYVGAAILFSIAFLIAVGVPLGYGDRLLDSVTPSFMDLSVPDRWWYAPIFFGLCGLALLLKVVIVRASSWHLITDKRVIIRHGILSTTRKKVDLSDVNSIEKRTPIPERFYNIGFIDIFTASTGGKEITLHGVHKPKEMANLIDQLRYDYLRRVDPYQDGMNGNPQNHPNLDALHNHPEQPHQQHQQQPHQQHQQQPHQQHQQQPQQQHQQLAQDQPSGQTPQEEADTQNSPEEPLDYSTLSDYNSGNRPTNS